MPVYFAGRSPSQKGWGRCSCLRGLACGSTRAASRIGRASIFLAAAGFASLFAAWEVPLPSYYWKPNEVLRFEYSKTIHIDETSAEIDSGARDFGFDAVLILELTNKTATGCAAVLRFDSPHFTIPEQYAYLAGVDDPALQKDRCKILARVMEGAMRLARWNVTLENGGFVRIDSRKPKTLDEWLRETEHAAFWRPKFRKMWIDIVENNLGIVATGEDREIFLSLAAPPKPGGGELDKIRPYRSNFNVLSNKDGKADFEFKRLPPPKAGQAYSLPYIGAPTTTGQPSIYITLNPVIAGPVTPGHPGGEAGQVGRAVFDTALGMLDTLSEQYSCELNYKCDEDAKHKYAMNQRVSVKYELKRLAPPLIPRLEKAIEAPIAPK
jgi:hypothetical protein